jgi:hypothetical protein
MQCEIEQSPEAEFREKGEDEGKDDEQDHETED